MIKSLTAGAAALALIAGAAFAQQAYDSTTTRPTTVTAPVPVVPAPVEQTTTVQRTVNPTVFDPSRTYHEEQVTTQDGAVVQKTVKSEAATPYGTRTSTYSQTTTSGNQ
jgi:hypothetical protein